MNQTEVLRRLESRLGASHRLVELMPDQIMDVVKQQTRRTFSEHFPYRANFLVDSKKDRVGEHQNMFYIRTELEVINVSRLITDTIYGSLGEYVQANNLFQDPFERQVNADLRSMIELPMTFQFIPPNVVMLKPALFFFNTILVEVGAHHPEHLGTIPPGLTEEFMKLAEYDVKSAIYSIRSGFNSINTPFGSIELNMEGFSDAADKRADLLEKWRPMIHKQANRRRIWFA